MLWIWIWLGVLAVSLILEFVTMELVSIWISFGSIVALILACCKVSYEIQIIVCVAVSVASILLLRKITLKFLSKSKEKTETNMDTIIGTKVKLITEITPDTMGSVKLNGVIWSVKTENDETVEANEYVKIIKVEGNKLIVEKEN